MNQPDERPLTGESALGAAVGGLALAIVGFIVAYYTQGLDIHLPGISPAVAADGRALLALGVLAGGSLGAVLGAVFGDLGPHLRVEWSFPRSDPLRLGLSGLALGALSGVFGASLATGVGLLAGRDVWLDWRDAGSVLLGAALIGREGTTAGEVWAGVGAFVAATAWWGLALGLVISFLRRRVSRTDAAVLAIAAAWLTALVDYYAVLSWLQPALVQSEPYWALALPRLAGALVFLAFPPVGGPSSPLEREDPPRDLLR